MLIEKAKDPRKRPIKFEFAVDLMLTFMENINKQVRTITLTLIIGSWVLLTTIENLLFWQATFLVIIMISGGIILILDYLRSFVGFRYYRKTATTIEKNPGKYVYFNTEGRRYKFMHRIFYFNQFYLIILILMLAIVVFSLIIKFLFF